jgi:hypothetical protein
MKEINSESFLDYYCDELLVAAEAMNIDTGNGAKYHPVFVVLVNAHSWFGVVADKLVKGQKYWHAGISFGPSLHSVYSFNMNRGTEIKANKIKGGLVCESYEEYIKENPESDIYISCIFLTQYRYKKLRATLDYYVQNKEKTSYSLGNLVNQFFGKNKTSGFNKVCSTFVDDLLKSVNIHLNDKPTDLVKPDNLYSGNEMQFTVFEGKIGNYDPEVAKKKVEAMANDKKYSYFKNGGSNSKFTSKSDVSNQKS